MVARFHYDDASMTRSGGIAGTHQYMSPEQSRGNDVDHRSDLFTLGSVLYWMRTGRSPFRAGTTMGVLNRIANDAPRPIRKINPDIPEWLCQIIARLMPKQPDVRFESTHEVAELPEERLAHVQQPTAVPLPATLVTQSHGSRFFSISRRRFGVIVMVTVFGFSLLGMVLWQATTPPDIKGRWTGEDGGEVVLEAKQPGKDERTYTEKGAEKKRQVFLMPTSGNDNAAPVAGPGDTASVAIVAAPESAPDPQIDNSSVESTSEQDDQQVLVVVDSADYGDTESMMKLVELERNAKTSKFRLTYKKRSSSVGSSMFILWGLYEVAKARGTEYFICLNSWGEPEGGSSFIAGFTNTKNTDIHETFGEFYSRTSDLPQPLKYWSVSEWEFLCRGVSWSPPNDDSEVKSEIAAIRLAVDGRDTPSQKHAVLVEAFAKSDSPHVKMRILQMAKVVKAPELEPFLLSVLQNKRDVRDRILAVMVLAEHGSATSIEPLLDCAENDPEGVAGAGCMRCWTSARRDAYLALAEIGLRHPAESDRIAAAVAAIPVTTNDAHDPKAQALYNLTQDPKLLKPFLERLQNEDPETRGLGVRALRPFKLSHAPEQLIELLADSNPDVGAAAARLLGQIEDPKTIPVLIEVATATERDTQVRCAAIRAIGCMRVERAESVMRELLTDEAVQVVAAIALFEITGQRHPLVPERYNLEKKPENDPKSGAGIKR